MNEQSQSTDETDNEMDTQATIRMGKAGQSFVIRARKSPPLTEDTMRYRPTPETDRKQWMFDCSACGTTVVAADFARRLERERDETREQRDMLAEALQAADECLALIEDVGHGAHMDNVTVARGIVQKALAAVKETSNDQGEARADNAASPRQKGN